MVVFFFLPFFSFSLIKIYLKLEKKQYENRYKNTISSYSPDIKINQKACCQFDPKWCNVKENMKNADELLEMYKKRENKSSLLVLIINRYKPNDIDILILPEMTFTGKK